MKRIISLILAVIMVATVLPVIVLANSMNEGEIEHIDELGYLDARLLDSGNITISIAQCVGHQRIAVFWTAIPNAIAYKVYFAEWGSNTYKAKATVTTNNCIVSGLELGRYKIRVKAYVDGAWTELADCPYVIATSEAYYGTCGDNLEWSRSTDGKELIISGIGDMYNYDPILDAFETCAPWGSYDITSVIIENGVTSIGDWAFYETDIASVTISDTVTRIGFAAFADCYNLTTVTIPDGVTDIENDAFSGCSSLTSITIPASVTSVGSCAFYNCPSLTSITFLSSTTEIFDERHTISDTATICGYLGSPAHEYAQQYGRTFIALNKEFELFVDNNSYSHSSGSSSSGFYKVKNYKIPDELFKKLNINHNLSKEVMKQKWGGSCYGIASTMAMVYNGELELSDISDSGAEHYYDLLLPYKEAKLLNSINYYQLSQYVDEKTVYYSGDYAHLALPTLFEILDSGEAAIFCYGYYNRGGSEAGHAIVAVGYEQLIDGSYKVKLYDENDITEFKYMTVSEDMTRFALLDANGNYVSNSTCSTSPDVNSSVCRYIQIVDTSDSWGIKPYSLAEEQTVTIIMPMSSSFVVTSASGETLAYDGEFGGTMEIVSIKPIIYDEYCELMITIPYSDILTITECEDDFSVKAYTDNDYLSASGEEITSVVLDFGDSIEVSSSLEEYEFSVFISTDETIGENETNLISLNGTATSDVKITYNTEDNTVTADSEGGVTDATAYSHIYTYKNVVSEVAIGDNKLIIATDDMPDRGDFTLDSSVDKNDAIYLLYSVLFGDSKYPLNQACDFNGDGTTDKNDAIYLLYHALFGAGSYPLN